MSKINRRDFLKLLGAAGAGLAARPRLPLDVDMWNKTGDDESVDGQNEVPVDHRKTTEDSDEFHYIDSLGEAYCPSYWVWDRDKQKWRYDEETGDRQMEYHFSYLEKRARRCSR